QDSLRDDRRLHLLRPALPRRRTVTWIERRGDRLQSVGNCSRSLTVPLEARTTCPRRRERILHGVQQSRRDRTPVEHRPVFRLLFLRRPARQLPRDRIRRQERARRRGNGSGHDRRGPTSLAVLSGPSAGLLRSDGGAASMSLLIRNGTIVTASDMYRGDVFVEGEQISTIGS